MKINFINILLFLFSIQLTSFSQYSSKELVKLKVFSKGADAIVTGKISKQISSWNKNKTRIFTEATLDVDESLKGNKNGGSIIVTYPGGEVEGVGELYTHMPRFENNEEVLVFLKKDKTDAAYKVFEGEEGKIKIINNIKTGEKVTSSNVQIKYLKAQIKNYLKEH